MNSTVGMIGPSVGGDLWNKARFCAGTTTKATASNRDCTFGCTSPSRSYARPRRRTGRRATSASRRRPLRSGHPSNWNQTYRPWWRIRSLNSAFTSVVCFSSPRFFYLKRFRARKKWFHVSSFQRRNRKLVRFEWTRFNQDARVS